MMMENSEEKIDVRSPISPNALFNSFFLSSAAPSVTAAATEPNAAKAASARTTRRSVLLSGAKEATPGQKSALAATAIASMTPARGLGALLGLAQIAKLAWSLLFALTLLSDLRRKHGIGPAPKKMKVHVT